MALIPENALADFRLLTSDLEAAVNSADVYARQGSDLDFVLLGLLSKAVRTCGAIWQLVESDYTEDAIALTRTLLDTFFTARFISMGDLVAEARGSSAALLNKREERDDSAGRAARFAGFVNRVVERSHWVGEKHNVPGLRSVPPEILELADRCPRHYSWSGLPGQTKAMAAEADPLHRDEGGAPATLLFFYDAYYPYLSHFVHPTIVALGPHVPTPGQPFRIFSRAQQPPDRLLCIFLATGFLIGVADVVTGTLDLGPPRNVLDRMFEFYHALAVDIHLRSTGQTF